MYFKCKVLLSLVYKVNSDLGWLHNLPRDTWVVSMTVGLKLISDSEAHVS